VGVGVHEWWGGRKEEAKRIETEIWPMRKGQ
jgi:hypothetical protein